MHSRHCDCVRFQEGDSLTTTSIRHRFLAIQRTESYSYTASVRAAGILEGHPRQDKRRASVSCEARCEKREEYFETQLCVAKSMEREINRGNFD